MAAELADLEFEARRLGERLATHFQQVYVRSMADVPICNEALAVAAVGFRVWEGQGVGVVVTPWFMNVVLAPLLGEAAPGRSGDKVSVALPAGHVDFLVGELAGFGRVLMCSLFSPMDDFVDQEAALATAAAALDSLLDAQLLANDPPPEVYPTAPVAVASVAVEPVAEKPTPELDRRALLRGGLRPKPEAPAA